MPRIEIAIDIRASPERCFDLARDLDLLLKSLPPSVRAVAGRTTGLIGMGEQVTWRGRVFGIVHEHTSLITAFERPRYFRDEMTRGRFKRFVHDHHFDPIPSGTRMRDLLEFESPLGALGSAVNALILTRYLGRLLHKRNAVVLQTVESEVESRGVEV